jgi:2-amino-4-hydroxy-6-hydroxymethyldihydropteridine diphosphokinase
MDIPVEIFLCLGSNQGDRLNFLDMACKQIGVRIGPVLKRSSVYETEPWSMKEVHPFLNQVLLVSTLMDPLDLLKAVKKIESETGRDGVHHSHESGRTMQPAGPAYTSRCIDIDILFYGAAIIDLPDLIIPHPLLAERRFVLMPVAEIAGNFIHPGLNRSMNELLVSCRDTGKVSPLPQYPQ